MKKKKKQEGKSLQNSFILNPLWISLIVFILGLLTYAAYSPAKKNKFTNWDDDRYILENKDITSLSDDNLKLLLTKEYEGNYHPLTMISFALDYQVGKLNPKTYIHTNILIHVVNTILVFFLIQGLVQKPVISSITSALFGLHPIHVESVAWISERKDVLYCFFFILSLIAYVYYCKSQRIYLYAFALILFTLSLLSKGMAVTLAVSLPLIDYLKERKLLSAKVLLEKIPFLIVAIGFGLRAIKAQQVQDIQATDFQFSFLERVAIAGNGFYHYIVNQLYPSQLAAFHPYPSEIPSHYWIITISVATLSLLLIFYLIKNQHKNFYNKIYLAGFLFFILNILLVLQILPVGKAMMADRYTYVSSLGFFLLIGAAINQINKKISGREFISYSLIALYGVFLFIKTQNQCKVWNNSISLWDNVLHYYPEADIAYLNRGLAKHRKGDKDGAIKDYKSAVEVNPSMTLAWNNLGSVYSESGQHQQALIFFNKAIELDSLNINTWLNRAKTKAELLDYEGAIDDYNTYLMKIPNNPDVLNDRGLAKYNLQQFAEAKLDYDRAIEAGKTNKIANLGIYYVNRGLCRSFLKDYEGAFRDYSAAINTHPNPGVVYFNRGILHCYLGDFIKGCEDLRTAEKAGMTEASEKVKSYCQK